MLIDIAISLDRNVNKKEAEKILKHNDLTIEIQRMWNVKAKMIPVIVGTIGTISKSLRQNLSNIPGKHEIKELQTTAMLGTAHALRGVPMQKCETHFTCQIEVHVAQTVNTEQLQHCIP